MPAELDLQAIAVTLQLAGVTTLLLLVLGLPLAWWLAHTDSRAKPLVEAITALPLVLPPTVLGFYLLILMNPQSGIGRFWVTMTGETLTFSFSGLVIGSIIYSLPFTVQPLQRAFEAVGRKPLDAAASLGASPLDAFFTVALPLARRGVLAAMVLTFAHTLGEFGVVLMIGGNLPGETRVVSIAIYEHVETLSYGSAHLLSALMLGFATVVLLAVYTLDRKSVVRI